MEIGKLIEYKKRNRNRADIESGKKILYKIKESVKSLSFHMFWWTSILEYNKNIFVIFQTVDTSIW